MSNYLRAVSNRSQLVLGGACSQLAARRLFRLLFLGFAFTGGFGVGLLLGFGFFHRLASLFGLLGAGFGTLLALLVEHLLAAEQFDERLVGAVALLPRRADD